MLTLAAARTAPARAAGKGEGAGGRENRMPQPSRPCPAGTPPGARGGRGREAGSGKEAGEDGARRGRAGARRGWSSTRAMRKARSRRSARQAPSGRSSGALALWRSGALALWRSGALALWRSGALALWRSGALALWRLIVSRGRVGAVKAVSPDAEEARVAARPHLDRLAGRSPCSSNEIRTAIVRRPCSYVRRLARLSPSRLARARRGSRKPEGGAVGREEAGADTGEKAAGRRSLGNSAVILRSSPCNGCRAPHPQAFPASSCAATVGDRPRSPSPRQGS